MTTSMMHRDARGHYTTLTDPDAIRKTLADPDAMKKLIARAFPGNGLPDGLGVADALASAGAGYTVAKRPLYCDPRIASDGEGIDAREVTSHVATFREDTGDTLGIVGSDYGVVQYADAFAAADILVGRGDMTLVNAWHNGARARLVGMLGHTVMPSADGAPNTLGHFAIFDASHDSSKCVSAGLWTVRVECTNGMTSRQMIQAHKIRHTSRASDRMEEATEKILRELLGDAQAEIELFARLAEKTLSVVEFTDVAWSVVGGRVEEDGSKKTRREREVAEMVEFFEGGNEGAGATAWGGYNSVTAWIRSRRDAMTDGLKSAKRFDSMVDGAEGKKAAHALKMLAR